MGSVAMGMHLYGYSSMGPCTSLLLSLCALVINGTSLLSLADVIINTCHAVSLAASFSQYFCKYELVYNLTLHSSVESHSEDSHSASDALDKERKMELSLSHDEETLMMSDDIIQCLFSAVENWEMMKEKASTENTATLPVLSLIHI